MSNNRVPAVKTTVSNDVLVKEIYDAANRLFGESLSEGQIGIILAQNSLETGHRKNMYNYNVGNIKYTGSRDKYNYIILNTKEYSGDKSYREDAKFRAYECLSDGVEDYLKLIKRKVWDALKTEDPVEFSKALKQSGYYTAPEKEYTNTLVSIYNSNKNKKPNSESVAFKEKNNTKNLLNKIFDLVSYMRLSIATYDADNKNIFFKKGNHGD